MGSWILKALFLQANITYFVGEPLTNTQLPLVLAQRSYNRIPQKPHFYSLLLLGMQKSSFEQASAALQHSLHIMRVLDEWQRYGALNVQCAQIQQVSHTQILSKKESSQLVWKGKYSILKQVYTFHKTLEYLSKHRKGVLLH